MSFWNFGKVNHEQILDSQILAKMQNGVKLIFVEILESLKNLRTCHGQILKFLQKF